MKAEDNTADEYEPIEIELLDFLNRANEKLNKRLTQTYKEAKQVHTMEKANKKLNKQRTAKLAVAQIKRAIRKRDYMLLMGETVPEIDVIIKGEVPEIEDYRKDLVKLRAR